jgi:nickel transport protein
MDSKKRLGRTHFYKRPVIILAFVLCFVLTRAPAVLAHKVYIFSWIEGDRVYTESYFSGKKKVMGGLIKVFDPSGKKLLEGKTNEKGEFSFKIPKKTDLRIVLEATMGHRAEYIIKAAEIPDTVERPESVKEKDDSSASRSSANKVDLEQIKLVIEEALDSRLKPIVKTLAKIKEERGPGFTEIIGGVGYIFGLVGLILYFKSRKKAESERGSEKI